MVLIGREVILVAAVAGTAALAAFGATTQDSGGAAAYVRIGFSEKDSVYLEIQAGQVVEAKNVPAIVSGKDGSDTFQTKVEFVKLTARLRVAPTVEELKTALFKTGESGPGFVQFPEITLPIPTDQLPEGIRAVKAKLRLYFRLALFPTPDYVGGEIAICRTDDRQRDWQYGTAVTLPLGAAVETAPVSLLPRFEKLKLVLEGRAGKNSLGVGARLTAGKAQLSDVCKDGMTVDVTMTVTDAAGELVASETRPFTQMGFS